MFFKIFLQPFTLYLFLSGYFLTFIIMMIQKSLLLNSFWISFVGGFTLCCIWGFCIKLLTILFAKQELCSLFGIPLPEGLADAFNNDDDDDLTLTDLYNPNDDHDFTENSFSSMADDLPISDKFVSSLSIDDPNNTEEAEASTSGRLDANGNFDLTVAGKTLKASPQDGAQAIRKTLHDSEKE